MTINDIKTEKSNPAVLANDQGIISWINPAFEKRLGWSSEEAVGQPLTLIIPKYLQHAHHLGFSRFLSTGKAKLLNQPLNLRTISKDGVEFDAEHIIVAENIEGQWFFGATIRPVS